MAHTYKYPRPALTVDTVIFGMDLAIREMQVLLVERGQDPYRGCWAIPGGFVNPGESIDDAARRELMEECGVKNVFLEQLYTFGDPDRDPREHVVTIAYYALVNINSHRVKAGTDASDARWFPLSELPSLAFDHDKILSVARKRLKDKIRYHPLGFELLPNKFTLSQLQHLYEVILEEPMDKRNFRKKIQSLGILQGLDELEENVPHRAAKLYRFDRKAYRQLEKEGARFAI